MNASKSPATDRHAAAPAGNETWLAEMGGPAAWGRGSALEAEDQMSEFGGVEGAYDAYSANVEDTLNEHGFDLSTERGRAVIIEAQEAFDEKYYELTGFDAWGRLSDQK